MTLHCNKIADTQGVSNQDPVQFRVALPAADPPDNANDTALRTPPDRADGVLLRITFS
jgi:hypothetical protein